MRRPDHPLNAWMRRRVEILDVGEVQGGLEMRNPLAVTFLVACTAPVTSATTSALTSHLAAGGMPVEAQAALLTTLAEPPTGADICIAVPPTLAPATRPGPWVGASTDSVQDPPEEVIALLRGAVPHGDRIHPFSECGVVVEGPSVEVFLRSNRQPAALAWMRNAERIGDSTVTALVGRRYNADFQYEVRCTARLLQGSWRVRGCKSIWVT